MDNKACNLLQQYSEYCKIFNLLDSLQDLIGIHCQIIRGFRYLNHIYSHSESVFASMATKVEDEHTGFNEGLEKPKYVLY